MTAEKSVIPVERIENSILLIRREKVMLDADLAELYGVPTKALNQAVKRNIDRFPEDFMFQLTNQEKKRWSQIVTTSSGSSFHLICRMHLPTRGNYAGYCAQ